MGDQQGGWMDLIPEELQVSEETALGTLQAVSEQGVAGYVGNLADGAVGGLLAHGAAGAMGFSPAVGTALSTPAGKLVNYLRTRFSESSGWEASGSGKRIKLTRIKPQQLKLHSKTPKQRVHVGDRVTPYDLREAPLVKRQVARRLRMEDSGIADPMLLEAPEPHITMTDATGKNRHTTQ